MYRPTAAALLVLTLALASSAQFPRPPKLPDPPKLPGGGSLPYPPAPRVPPLPAPPLRRSAEAVPKSRRALLVVSAGLKKHGDKKYAALYQFLESSGAGVSRDGLSGVYGELTVLEGRNGTLDAFLDKLYSLSRRYDAVDLVLHQHGMPGELVFEDGSISLDDLAKKIVDGISNSRGKLPGSSRAHLRLVWETACFGSSHAAGWQKVGFDAVVGAKGVHADSAASFPAFVGWWRNGYNLSETTNAANRADPARLLDKWADGPLGFDDVNSQRTISGNGNITIGSAARL